VRDVVKQLVYELIVRYPERYLFVHQKWIPALKERKEQELGLDLLIIAIKDIVYAQMGREDETFLFQSEDGILERAIYEFTQKRLLQMLKNLLHARQKMNQNVHPTLVIEQLVLQFQRWVIMIEVIGVRFKEAGKIYYFDPNDLDITMDDYVIVETVRGIEFGHVVIVNKQVDEDDVVLPLKKVERIANDEDIANVRENEQLAKKAMEVCVDKIKFHQLDMNLVDVEYTFDRSKVVFYFTAEGRIDFRDLVKDLASQFKTRIEL